jgi:tryptophanase
VVEEGKHPDVVADFKGNMDIHALDNFIQRKGAENIPLIMLTVTNNSIRGNLSFANFIVMAEYEP